MHAWYLALVIILALPWLTTPRSDYGQFLLESVVVLAVTAAVASHVTRASIRIARYHGDAVIPDASRRAWAFPAGFLLLTPLMDLVRVLAFILLPISLAVDTIYTFRRVVGEDFSWRQVRPRSLGIRLWHLVAAVFLVAVVMGMWRDVTSRVALIVFVAGTGECALGTAAILMLFRTLAAIGYATEPREYAQAIGRTALVAAAATFFMTFVIWAGRLGRALGHGMRTNHVEPASVLRGLRRGGPPSTAGRVDSRLFSRPQGRRSARSAAGQGRLPQGGPYGRRRRGARPHWARRSRSGNLSRQGVSRDRHTERPRLDPRNSLAHRPHDPQGIHVRRRVDLPEPASGDRGSCLG